MSNHEQRSSLNHGKTTPEPQTEVWTLPKANGLRKELASIKDIQIKEIIMWEINIYWPCFVEKEPLFVVLNLYALIFFFLIFTTIFLHHWFCFNVTFTYVTHKTMTPNTSFVIFSHSLEEFNNWLQFVYDLSRTYIWTTVKFAHVLLEVPTNSF